MLVCAPSNAAVDEICLRLLEEGKIYDFPSLYLTSPPLCKIKTGLLDSTANTYRPSIVRVGVESSVHPVIQGIFLDNLLEQRLHDKKDSLGKAGTAVAEVKASKYSTTINHLLIFFSRIE